MEEGEIVRVSLVAVVRDGCEVVMSQLLQRLHTVAMCHLTLSPWGATGGVAGGEGEFAVRLQCGLCQWSLMLSQENPSSKWCG